MASIEEDSIEPTGNDINVTTMRSEVLRIMAQFDDRAAPDAVLKAATDPSNVLHRYFTWDDSVAAGLYRLAQAGSLCRRVRLDVMRLDAEHREIVFETVRAVTSVPDERMRKNSASYGRTTEVMRNEERRASVLRGIVRELMALRTKYATYSELHDVWVVIEDVADTWGDPVKRRKPGNKPPATPPASS